MISLLLLILAQPAPPPSPVKWVVVDGGYITISNFPASQAVTAAALPLPAGAATEATLLTRTKPADQQHVIVDSSANISVGNFPALQPVSVTSLPAHAVTALGADGGTTFDVSGSVVVIASPYVVFAPMRNPFLPRCNPVRRNGCVP